MLERLSEILTIPAMQAFVGENAWAWPVCEMFHYVGMSLVIGMIGTMDLRILGMFKGIPIGAFRPLVPIAIGGFIVNLVSGLIMVTGNAPDSSFYVMNLSFQLKVLALLLAFLNLLVFQFSGLERKVYAVPAGGDAPGSAKVVALVSLVAWVFTIIFGRLLMYNDTLLFFLGL